MVGAMAFTSSSAKLTFNQRQHLHSFSFLSSASLFNKCCSFGIQRLGLGMGTSKSRERCLKTKMGGAIAFTSSSANLTSPQLNQRQHQHFFSFLSSASLFNGCSLFGIRRLGQGMGISKCRERGLVVRACGDPNNYSCSVPPLQFESPVGKLLAQIMQTQPHLLSTAINQQLENLQHERDEAPLSPPHLLYERIGEVKEKERQKSVEGIIYSLIVQKFLEKGIFMIEKISPTSGRLDFPSSQGHKLISVHSSGAMELIQSHLNIVLRELLVCPHGLIRMSKIKLGKLYAASILYGYYFRRVDQRFQLEISMNTLPKRCEDDDDDEEEEEEGEEKPYNLRSYLGLLDVETLERYLTIRSKEANSLLENQTRALFGEPDFRLLEDGSIDTSNDQVIPITIRGLGVLVLEAVTFGSFMWDSEIYVESKYRFLDG